MANARILQEAIMKLLSKVDSSPMTPGNTKPNMTQMLTNDLAAPRSLPLADDIPVSGVRDEVVNQGDIFRGMPNVSNELPTVRDTVATEMLAKRLGLKVGKSQRRIPPNTSTGTKQIPENQNGTGPQGFDGTSDNELLGVADVNYNQYQKALLEEKGYERPSSVFDGQHEAQGGSMPLAGDSPNPLREQNLESLMKSIDDEGRTSRPIKGKLEKIRAANKRKESEIDFEGDAVTKETARINMLMQDGALPVNEANKEIRAFGVNDNVNKYVQTVTERFDDTFDEKFQGLKMDGTKTKSKHYNTAKIQKSFASVIRDKKKELSQAAKVVRNGNATDDARRAAIAKIKEIDSWVSDPQVGSQGSLPLGASATSNPSNRGPQIEDLESLAFSRTGPELAQQRKIHAQQGPNNAKFGKSGKLLGDDGVKELRNPTFPNVLN
jgi:hypothetical protein